MADGEIAQESNDVVSDDVTPHARKIAVLVSVLQQHSTTTRTTKSTQRNLSFYKINMR
jgi:hypothetical protein